MLREGDLNRCGIALLAGKAVGAPFVAACLVLCEILRLLHGGECTKLLILTCRAQSIVRLCRTGGMLDRWVKQF